MIAQRAARARDALTTTKRWPACGQLARSRAPELVCARISRRRRLFGPLLACLDAALGGAFVADLRPAGREKTRAKLDSWRPLAAFELAPNWPPIHLAHLASDEFGQTMTSAGDKQQACPYPRADLIQLEPASGAMEAMEGAKKARQRLSAWSGRVFAAGTGSAKSGKRPARRAPPEAVCECLCAPKRRDHCWRLLLASRPLNHRVHSAWAARRLSSANTACAAQALAHKVSLRCIWIGRATLHNGTMGPAARASGRSLSPAACRPLLVAPRRMTTAGAPRRSWQHSGKLSTLPASSPARSQARHSPASVCAWQPAVQSPPADTRPLPAAAQNECVWLAICAHRHSSRWPQAAQISPPFAPRASLRQSVCDNQCVAMAGGRGEREFRLVRLAWGRHFGGKSSSEATLVEQSGLAGPPS